MSATILYFPGFLLAEDGVGFGKDGRYHANVDVLTASLSERERCRMLDWNRRRFPEVIHVSGRRRMNDALFHSPGSLLDLEPFEPARPLRRKEAIAAQQARLRTLMAKGT